MSQSKKIIVRIGKDGKINLEAKGYTGDSCNEATKFLEDLMVVEETGATADMYDTEAEARVMGRQK